MINFIFFNNLHGNYHYFSKKIFKLKIKNNSMKIVASIVLILLALNIAFCMKASDQEIFSQFQTFMEEHQKSYKTVEEFKERFEIFKQNYRKIERNQLNNIIFSHLVLVTIASIFQLIQRNMENGLP